MGLGARSARWTGRRSHDGKLTRATAHLLQAVLLRLRETSARAAEAMELLKWYAYS